MLRRLTELNTDASFNNKDSVIHTEQPWFVLGAAKHYDFAIPTDPAISHFYTFEANQSDSTTFAIPDGTVDILFDCDQANPGAKICGSTLQANSAQLKHKHRYFGVRFVAGVVPGFLNLVADDLVNQELDLFDLQLENEELLYQVANTPGFLSQIDLFRNILNTKPHRGPTILTKKLIYEIYGTKGTIRVSELADLTGCSSRTLQRQFQSDMGMSPKAFSRIVRGQTAVHNISHCNQLALSELASDLGFSDQSHFQREFKKLISTTPLNYQRQIKEIDYLNKIRRIS